MHLNNFAGIKEPPSHKLALQIVSQAFSMNMHTFFTVVWSVCTHSLVVLLRLTHNFSFQYRSCSHPFKCLYILITWLTSLLPVIRYLSYIQVFTLINSAAMNVFVKKLPFLWILPPWEYLQRGIVRSKSMKYCITLTLLPDCFLERSNLWVGRTVKVNPFNPLWMLELLQFMMPPAMYKHFYLPIALPVLGFAILIYFCLFNRCVQLSLKGCFISLIASKAEHFSMWWFTSYISLCVKCPSIP